MHRGQRRTAGACPACGGGLRSLGEDVAEQLEYVPASFRVIRHVRPKLACSCCDVILQAPAPSRPIERGIAGPGLLAHVLVAKFADHLPLYRQAVIYARDGVDLDRALLASWVGAARALLRPLVDAIRRHAWPVQSCTRTTPRFRCWHRAMGRRRRRRGCGPTCVMTRQAATRRHRPWGLPIRPIAGHSSANSPRRLQGRTASGCLRRL